MNITALNPLIPSLSPIERGNEPQNEELGLSIKQPTFFDVFSGIFNNAIETNQQKSEDMVNLMLGDVDNLEQIMLNVQKAEIATELFINVKNATVDAYTEIMRMNI